MSWRSPLCPFVLLGGAVLWLSGFGVLAQEQSFFTGSSPVSLTAEQASRIRMKRRLTNGLPVTMRPGDKSAPIQERVYLAT